jgi:hypothetical protein
VISSEHAVDLVMRHALVRVHSGAIGHEAHVMAEGIVIGYLPAPSLLIEHADGTQSHWSVDLPIVELPEVPDA